MQRTCRLQQLSPLLELLRRDGPVRMATGLQFIAEVPESASRVDFKHVEKASPTAWSGRSISDPVALVT